jgi:hypothetical protein
MRNISNGLTGLLLLTLLLASSSGITFLANSDTTVIAAGNILKEKIFLPSFSYDNSNIALLSLPFLQTESNITSEHTETANSSSNNDIIKIQDTNNNNNDNRTVDKFGITKIYPTKHNGREWYLNMDDPQSDGIFNTTAKLKREIDGSWRVDASNLPRDREGNVRMQVFTLPGVQQWKNVEITGYARVVKTKGHDSDKKSDLENILQWYARGGRHSSNSPCEGTSLKGRIHLNGKVGWVKEIWHAGGYTSEEASVQATSQLVTKKSSGGRYHDGRWFG